MVEDRLLAFVEFDDFLLLRRNERDVLARLFVDCRIVNVNVGETVIQEVAKHCSGLGILRKEQTNGLVLRNSGPGALPLFNKGLDLRNKHRGILAFGCSADNGSIVFRKYAAHQGLQPLPFLLGFYLLGNTHLLREGEQYNVSSCK